MDREKVIYYYNNLHNGDEIEATGLEGRWEVRYTSYKERWVEVSDEDDTVRHIVYWDRITQHYPLLEIMELEEED